MSVKNNILLYKEKSNVAYLTLNRPKAQNALSSDLLKRLLDELKKIELNKNIKVVVISSNGKNFCSGHDLKELARDKNKQRFNRSFLCRNIKMLFDNLKQAVIWIMLKFY